MNKFNLWTITFIDPEGYMQFAEAENRKEVIEVLDSLKLNGAELDKICVFPPMSNVTYEELIS